MFIPSHADVSKEIGGLAQYNINKVMEVAERIIDICNQPLCFESVLQRLFSDYELDMTFEQYVLVGSTVRSYLAWLKDTSTLQSIFEKNMLLWQRI